MTVRVDPVKLAEVLRGPQGPVVRRLLQDGEIVKQGARRFVGVHRPLAGERRSRRAGTLRDSIVKRLVPAGDSFKVVVGSADPIALLHHEGTRPHVIEPIRVKVLAFPTRGGTFVFTPQVHHPGTQPNRYLLKALALLGPRYH